MDAIVAKFTAILASLLMIFGIGGEKTFSYEQKLLSFGDTEILVDISDTPEKRSLGLSGRKELEEGTGMLFIFPEDGLHSFWMKDMHFSIDMLWLDKDYKVVHVEGNVSPETFPESFKPDEAARFVLEVSAGYSEKEGIEEESQFALTEVER